MPKKKRTYHAFTIREGQVQRMLHKAGKSIRQRPTCEPSNANEMKYSCFLILKFTIKNLETRTPTEKIAEQRTVLDHNKSLPIRNKAFSKSIFKK